MVKDSMESDERPCRLGVCVMAKKARSAGMKGIITHLNEFQPDLDVVVFEEELVLKEDVENWPICEFLIAFHSDGFPLEKVQAYSHLRQPVLLCNLERQYDILDRRKVLDLLKDNEIPYPETYYADDNSRIKQDGDQLSFFVEEEEVKTLDKPFIEKPFNSEDHNVWLYYPYSEGGGVRKMFRKTRKKSSEFVPGEWEIRRDGSYLYQRMYESEDRNDIKVYTVGTSFVYAESRKAPTVDGLVERTVNGKEVRREVGLSEFETEIAIKVSSIMQQFICGFDLLRANGESFVIDVNGWSFVKGNRSYYLATGRLLADWISNHSRFSRVSKSV
ncbi:hypothetical protein NDN08_004998 [Rhodosorus marinus]|uniref:ATP-grasp domain-containing protein n=1 Tax=Rhodosorus marinus TaxID=101924 RepID=A0AAV8UHY8_9RHOD|nr:hypothetical protein NDN08_004998 [Rhodosorus marinus]